MIISHVMHARHIFIKSNKICNMNGNYSLTNWLCKVAPVKHSEGCIKVILQRKGLNLETGASSWSLSTDDHICESKRSVIIHGHRNAVNVGFETYFKCNGNSSFHKQLKAILMFYTHQTNTRLTQRRHFFETPNKNKPAALSIVQTFYRTSYKG